MLRKLTAWYKSQPDTVKGAIWLGIILIIGIILRWDYVLDGISRGFGYYSK